MNKQQYIIIENGPFLYSPMYVKTHLFPLRDKNQPSRFFSMCGRILSERWVSSGL